jgi:two-component system osmolarity sensor histidine kinase EnvZ
VTPSRWFGSYRRRLTLLVALTVTLVMGAAGAILSWRTLDAGADQIARVLHASLVLADARVAEGGGAEVERLGYAVRSKPPEAAGGRLPPLLREVGSRLAILAGDPTRVRVGVGPSGEVLLWFAGPRAGGRWVGLAVEPVRERVLGGALVALLLTGVMVALAAGGMARALTRPLEDLTRRAPDLVAGRDAAPPDPAAPDEVQALASALSAAAHESRRLARERELMLAGISHDLRTPLARLAMALELGDAADPDARGAMRADLAELEALTGRFIDLVRDGRDEPTEIVDLAGWLGDMLATRATDEAWVLRMRGEGHAVQVPPLALRRAVVNLLDNAVRHGAAPRAIEVDRDAQRVAISVIDHGPGVPAGVAEDPARPFKPGRGASARTGLGVAIAARVATALGGHLTFTRDAGGAQRATLAWPSSPK